MLVHILLLFLSHLWGLAMQLWFTYLNCYTLLHSIHQYFSALEYKQDLWVDCSLELICHANSHPRNPGMIMYETLLNFYLHVWFRAGIYTYECVCMYAYIFFPYELQTYPLYTLDLIGNTRLFFKIGLLHFYKQCRRFQHLVVFKIF